MFAGYTAGEVIALLCATARRCPTGANPSPDDAYASYLLEQMCAAAERWAEHPTTRPADEARETLGRWAKAALRGHEFNSQIGAASTVAYLAACIPSIVTEPGFEWSGNAIARGSLGDLVAVAAERAGVPVDHRAAVALLDGGMSLADALAASALLA